MRPNTPLGMHGSSDEHLPFFPEPRAGHPRQQLERGWSSVPKKDEAFMPPGRKEGPHGSWETLTLYLPSAGCSRPRRHLRKQLNAGALRRAFSQLASPLSGWRSGPVSIWGLI